MGTESQHSRNSEPESASPATPPAPQVPAASPPGDATSLGETSAARGEERAVVRGARVDDTYVRTRIPPISHTHPADEAPAQIPTESAGKHRMRLPRAGRLLGGLPRRRLRLRFARSWRGTLTLIRASAGHGANRLSLLGMVAAGVLLVAFILVRFGRGGWVVAALIVGLGAVPLLATRWRGAARRRARARKETDAHASLAGAAPRHIVLVPIGGLNQPTLQCLLYARSIIPEVRAVYVATDETREAMVRAAWQNWIATCYPPSALATGERSPSASERGVGGQPHRRALLPAQPQLVVIESLTHTPLPPLLAYITATCENNLDAIVTIVLPACMPEYWWRRPLAYWTVYRLKLALYQFPRVVVTTVPYRPRK